jgi:hypothetical protein
LALYRTAQGYGVDWRDEFGIETKNPDAAVSDQLNAEKSLEGLLLKPAKSSGRRRADSSSASCRSAI